MKEEITKEFSIIKCSNCKLDCVYHFMVCVNLRKYKEYLSLYICMECYDEGFRREDIERALGMEGLLGADWNIEYSPVDQLLGQ